jgi:hypothetical protein
MNPFRHHPDRYDEHLVLRVPPTIWLALVFLVRHLLLLGITFMPTTGQEITALRDWIRPEYALADLAALPVLAVAAARRPRSPRWMRRLWRHGRWLLTLSALGFLGLAGRLMLVSERPLADTLDQPTLIAGLLSLAIVAYVWRSPLVRDLFGEFPEESAAATGGR